MANRSSYNRTYGARPTDTQPHKIVKRKKFSELDFCAILKPIAIELIETWVEYGSEDEFVQKVYDTLKAMYTCVRNKHHPESTFKADFHPSPQFEGARPPRYDLFERGQNATKRLSASQWARANKPKILKEPPASSSKLLERLFPFDPLLNPTEEKLGNLEGDKTLMYCLKPRDQNFTHNRGVHNGLPLKPERKAEQIDTHTISAMQMAIPDPVVLRKSPHLQHCNISTQVKVWIGIEYSTLSEPNSTNACPTRAHTHHAVAATLSTESKII